MSGSGSENQAFSRGFLAEASEIIAKLDLAGIEKAARVSLAGACSYSA
jgi:hypothetical protein